ncbi:ATP-binding protein involved in chromosome partitioning [Altererythrobacter atlanticus]|uniref:Iron-sulfur cluster carrier protein n=1 Tax=Croceibacterium atlanticum TaxID=1267766 RepID=A0A0F7KX74_9SPHN|nr:Mrp/NBP35 family ATP-binding protein [Croceibacterium atlanticum]AKH43832.1 Septum site-determining protein MinD [Croceibacterium atlanticum]MBB5733718.1 ATP-binding protein involved in chromosome partitioning [Croceibacterium atlanticum]
MTSAEDIKQQIPPKIAAFVRSVRFADGVATIVADASGLGRAAAAELQRELESHASAVDGVSEVRVALMADRVARRIIAIGSGKGGVGKSTLTANLAVALARMGRKVGVVDADVYGPSQVMLLDAANQKVKAEDDKLVPVESEFGVKLLSMAQLVQPGKAIAWRGPMVGNALSQLMDSHWGDTELLLIDLPPGTGDVQLTMLQKFKPAGAIVVSTPQDLALIDATRAIDLFRQAQVPVIGLVENMAGYVCPHCGEISDPFGQGGAEAASRALGEDFLGRVPLAMEIRVASDTGQPPAANDTEQGRAFTAIAERLSAWLDANKE